MNFSLQSLSKDWQAQIRNLADAQQPFASNSRKRLSTIAIIAALLIAVFFLSAANSFAFHRCRTSPGSR
jgi:uncharacterized membrane protein